MGLLRKYKWLIIALVALYAGISLWLFFLAGSPADIPFEYQFN